MLISIPAYATGLGSGGGGFSGGFAGRRGNGYYTIPTTTTVDSSGNTTNYYRSGPTSPVALINSANKTLSFYQNKDYTINNNTSYWEYQANVDLSNFLNSYTYNITTNNYDIDYNTYVYNTTNNYYNITIDNSTTNYNYDIQVEYAPQYTQVTYVSNSSEINNVTNIYYYALYDGRSSVDLTVNEVFGLATDYSGGNYDLVTEDENTLSLQHFDGDYADSSAYEQAFYANPNRSTTYIGAGDFGQAVSLSSGQRAGITISNLTSYDALSIEFRYQGVSKKSAPQLYFGDSLFLTSSEANVSQVGFMGDTSVSTLVSTSFCLGYRSFYYPPFPTDNPVFNNGLSLLSIDLSKPPYSITDPNEKGYVTRLMFAPLHFSPLSGWDLSVWHSYRLVLTNITESQCDVTLYIDGDSCGSGTYYVPLSGDSISVSGPGTLDELRVSTGDMVTTPDFYDTSTIPFDTNKVLALPENPEEGKIYVRSSIPVTAIRVGGVRPSNPTKGFVYVPLDKDYKGAGCQISDGTSWEDVDGYIYDSGSWQSVIGYRFLTVGDYDDVTKPDDPATPTPTPGGGGGGGSGDDPDKESIWDKLGNLLGGIVDGIGKAVNAVVGHVIDWLTSLVEIIGDKFTQVIEMVLGWFESIPSLFAGFMGFLSAIFPFLPPEIMLLLTFGVAAIVFIGILKAVRR